MSLHEGDICELTTSIAGHSKGNIVTVTELGWPSLAEVETIDGDRILLTVGDLKFLEKGEATPETVTCPNCRRPILTTWGYCTPCLTFMEEV